MSKIITLGNLSAFKDKLVTLFESMLSSKADVATTISGYGITDAKIEDNVITLGENSIEITETDISGKADVATTLSGYGITDAHITDGVIILGSNSITPLTEHQDISGKADSSTTLSGYGITDAKIEDGVITLGSNTITPLTAHQDISGKADVATSLSGYGITDAYTKSEVDSIVSSVYRYKGSVSTYASLPTEELVVGDVYNIEAADSENGIDAGDNVAWNGTTWDKLAGTVDTSAFAIDSDLHAVAKSGSFNDLEDKPVVADTYDPASANAMSGVAVNQAFEALGLSVVNGMICVTYEEENNESSD